MHRYSLLGFGKDVNDGVSNCARRSFLVKSEMRSLNLGTAAIALSNVVLGMVIYGGEKRKISVKYCSGSL